MSNIFKTRIQTLHSSLVIESTDTRNTLKAATAAKILQYIKLIVSSKTRKEIKEKINQVITHLNKYRNQEVKEVNSELSVLYTLV